MVCFPSRTIYDPVLYQHMILGPRSILPSPCIMLERDTSLAEQPFNGESMKNSSYYIAGRLPVGD